MAIHPSSCHSRRRIRRPRDRLDRRARAVLRRRDQGVVGGDTLRSSMVTEELDAESPAPVAAPSVATAAPSSTWLTTSAPSRCTVTVVAVAGEGQHDRRSDGDRARREERRRRPRRPGAGRPWGRRRPRPPRRGTCRRRRGRAPHRSRAPRRRHRRARADTVADVSVVASVATAGVAPVAATCPPPTVQVPGVHGPHETVAPHRVRHGATGEVAVGEVEVVAGRERRGAGRRRHVRRPRADRSTGRRGSSRSPRRSHVHRGRKRPRGRS